MYLRYRLDDNGKRVYTFKVSFHIRAFILNSFLN